MFFSQKTKILLMSLILDICMCCVFLDGETLVNDVNRHPSGMFTCRQQKLIAATAPKFQQLAEALKYLKTLWPLDRSCVLATQGWGDVQLVCSFTSVTALGLSLHNCSISRGWLLSTFRTANLKKCMAERPGRLIKIYKYNVLFAERYVRVWVCVCKSCWNPKK